MFCAENWVWTQVRRTSLCPWRVNPQPGGPNRSAAPTGRPGEEQKKKKRAMTSPTRPGQSRPEEQFCYSPVTPPDPQSFALLWGTDTDPGGGPHRQHQPGKQDQRKTRPVSGNLTKRHVFFVPLLLWFKSVCLRYDCKHLSHQIMTFTRATRLNSGRLPHSPDRWDRAASSSWWITPHVWRWLHQKHAHTDGLMAAKYRDFFF